MMHLAENIYLLDLCSQQPGPPSRERIAVEQLNDRVKLCQLDQTPLSEVFTGNGWDYEKYAQEWFISAVEGWSKEVQFEQLKSFAVSQLTDALTICNDTLRNYAKSVGVKTPGRGQRNFQYSRSDVIRILKAMKKASDKRVRDKASAVFSALNSTI
ncbi:hypothetical protein ACFL6U_12915 [Planctomycetota bacterium]